MKVKGYLLATLIIGVLLVTTGCLKQKQVLKIKPDGSGTLEITLGISESLLGAMKISRQELMELLPEGTLPEGEEEPPSFEEEVEEAIKQKAETWPAKTGRNVELKEFKKSTQDEMIYFTAVYSFKNIRKLELNPFETPIDPGPLIPIPDEANLSFYMHLWEDKLFTFDLKKLPDGSAELIIINPFGILIAEAIEELTKETKEQKPLEKKDNSGGKEDKPDEFFEGMILILKPLLKNATWEFTLVIEGKITEADVNVEDNKITLVNIDFGAIVKNQEKLDSLIKELEDYQQDPSTHDETPEELTKMSLKQLMKILGTTIIEPKEQIKVRFK